MNYTGVDLVGQEGPVGHLGKSLHVLTAAGLHEPASMSLSTQLLWLFVLAAPVACLAWTVTHEEIFADLRQYCGDRSRHGRGWAERKFFYLFTCEYCFSHYIALGGVLVTGLRLLVPDFWGSVLAWLATVWVANIYMGLFARLRLDIKRERVEITQEEHVAEKLANDK
jgi:hypothetical protein